MCMEKTTAQHTVMSSTSSFAELGIGDDKLGSLVVAVTLSHH